MKYTRWTEMPHLDEKYVRHNVCHLVALGLLTLPHLTLRSEHVSIGLAMGVQSSPTRADGGS